MAIIPAGSKVMTVASTVDTNERKSTQANSPTQYYSIEDIAETVTGSSTAPTTTTVNISSSETTYSDGRPTVASGILAMGSTPIELLPAAGANKYYDIEKIILEYTHVTTAYTTTSTQIYITQGSDMCYLPTLITNTSNDQYVIGRELNVFDGGVFSSVYKPIVNESLKLWNYNNDNPTLGDGTLRAIITYTTRTFGA